LIHCHDFQASEKFCGNENLKSLFKFLYPTGSVNKPQCMQIFIARGFTIFKYICGFSENSD